MQVLEADRFGFKSGMVTYFTSEPIVPHLTSPASHPHDSRLQPHQPSSSTPYYTWHKGSLDMGSTPS